MAAPDPQDVNSAARLVGDSPEVELAHGQIADMLQRFSTDAPRAVELNAELTAVVERHLEAGLLLTDAAFVLAVHVNVMATTLHRSLPADLKEPALEECVLMALDVYKPLQKAVPTTNALFVILSQMLSSCLASSAVAAQQSAANAREEGQR